MQSEWRGRLEQTIFGDFLSPANLMKLVSIAEFIELQSGQYLFREGQENHKVFVLLEGQLDLTMTVPGRGPTRILTLGPGELVAWSAILGEGIMTSSANCVEPAQLIAADQALDRVSRFLDDTLVTDLHEVRIVHGHGTGQLRKGIGAFLKTHPQVEKYYAAPDNQGGGGATIVELKD